MGWSRSEKWWEGKPDQLAATASHSLLLDLCDAAWLAVCSARVSKRAWLLDPTGWKEVTTYLTVRCCDGAGSKQKGTGAALRGPLRSKWEFVASEAGSRRAQGGRE